MPSYYQTSKVMDNICNVNAIELNNFNIQLQNTLNQFFIDTADFTLERWEKEFGIEVNTNLDSAYRISRIKSKMRGQGTCTITLIKNVADSFTNGDVDVIEDNINYQFTIKFTSILGIPPNMDDLRKAIEDIKPAHLGVTFEFTYNTYSILSNQTYSSLSSFTNDDLRTYKF